MLASGEGATAIALGLAMTLGTGVLLGLVVALALIELIRRHAIPDRLEAQVTLALVLATFVGGDAIVHEAGLVAVTMMGFVLANQRRAPIAPIVHFKELLATLLLGSLFVTLAASIEREALLSLDASTALFVAALIVIARPAATFLSLLGSRTTLAERAFVAGLAPRGVVAVSVAALFADRLEGVVPDADRLVPTVFAVVLGTVLVYGLGSGPLARGLGLAQKKAEGVLLIGATRFGRSLADALGRLGLPCVLLDRNAAALAEARLSGLRTIQADATEPHLLSRVPMGGLGRAIALTPNAEVNRLAAQQFEEFFGRAEVYRLRDGHADLELGAGRSLFAEAEDAESLDARMASGEQVRSTRLTDAFSLDDWRGLQGPAALLLGRLDSTGQLHLSTGASTVQAGAGDHLLYIAPETAPLATE